MKNKFKCPVNHKCEFCYTEESSIFNMKEKIKSIIGESE